MATVAILSAWVVLPLAERWDTREAAIAARETQLAQLQGLVKDRAAIQQQLADRRRQRERLRDQLLTGATAALAASSLQALLQQYANASRVTLDRVDLVAGPGQSQVAGLPPIPVELSATGDIHGLADLLRRLQYGDKLLVIDQLQVSAGDAGNVSSSLLTWSVRLHGVYSPE